ncbi:MAG: hypothetical protein HC808_05425 [Candidatus Competibacteraceae bacterium]|nr:hypothetical protein [Candidatus Competibacteraceae bacterium]
MKLICRIAFIAVVTGTSLTTSTAAFAAWIEYTGKEFSAIADASEIGGSYTTSMSVEGLFKTTGPLPSSMTFMNVSPLVERYRFTEGRNVLTELNSDGRFFLATDPAGNIVEWNIFLEIDFPSSPPLAGEISTTIGTQTRTVATEIEADRDRGSIRECITPGTLNQCAGGMGNGQSYIDSAEVRGSKNHAC